MRRNGLPTIDRAVQTTHVWLADVARMFDTDDLRFAYRVTRAWLHNLRDRLPVEVSAHFAAGLPELLRGLYYDGWDPSRVPAKFGPDEYRQRFAAEARIPVVDVPAAARTVTAALAGHLTPGQLEQALGQLPQAVRELISPPPVRPAVTAAVATDTVPVSPNGSRPGATPSIEQRIARLEQTAQVLTDALQTLSTGWQATPTSEADADRGPRAARLAHEILLTAPGDSF